jgi:HEAT repeat protein
MVKRRRVPKDVGALLKDLRNPATFVRRSAVVDLARRRPPEALDPMVGLLRDREAAIRACAAWALGEMDYAQAAPALAACLVRDMDPDVRRAAAQSLSKMARPEHRSALESASVDADRWVAEWCRRGLDRLAKAPSRRRRDAKAGAAKQRTVPRPPPP